MENDAFTGPSADLAELAVINFGRRVRDLRTARALTQAELARVMSLTGRSYHQTTIAKLESGSRPTSVEELHLLATILGIEVEDFFRHDGVDAKIRAEAVGQAAVLSNLAGEITVTQDRLEQMKKDYAISKERLEQLKAKLSSDHPDATQEP